MQPPNGSIRMWPPLLLVALLTFGRLAVMPGCAGANILAVFPSDYRSHFTLGSALFGALAERGHHLTIISQYKLPAHQRHANITEIHLDGVAEHFVEIGLVQQSESVRRIDQSFIDEIINLIYSTSALANYTLSHPDVQRLLALTNGGESPFDLLLLDMYYNDALLGMAEHFGGIPTVVLCSTSTNKWPNEMVGNPHHPAYNPSIFLGFTDRMGLMERLVNAMASAFEKITYNYMYLPVQDTIYHRYFDDNRRRQPLPPLIDLIHNVSLVLLNSHTSLQYPRPHTPNMLHIGGMHLAQAADGHLSDYISDYLNEAPEGCIYMSLGSARRSSDLPDDQIAAFTTVFGRLAGRMRVIWKWENATLVGQPPNVIIGSFMPQRAILAHPNVRLFITNGGASSLLEAIDSETPIIGIPMNGDQFFNVAQAVRNGLGVKLDGANLTAESIGAAIEAVLGEENAVKTKERVTEMRKLLHDNAVAPMELAVYGIEHVLRTGGARHWRSPAVDLSLLQQSLVDVAAIILLIVAVIVAVPSVVICAVLRRNHARQTRGAKVGGGVGGGKKKSLDGGALKKSLRHLEQHQKRKMT